MKKTIRYASYVLAFFGLSSLEACKDDEPSDLCYECDGDIGGYAFNETLCFSDYKADYTKDEFIAYIGALNDYGASCSKK